MDEDQKSNHQNQNNFRDQMLIFGKVLLQILLKYFFVIDINLYEFDFVIILQQNEFVYF